MDFYIHVGMIGKELNLIKGEVGTKTFPWSPEPCRKGLPVKP